MSLPRPKIAEATASNKNSLEQVISIFDNVSDEIRRVDLSDDKAREESIEKVREACNEVIRISKERNELMEKYGISDKSARSAFVPAEHKQIEDILYDGRLIEQRLIALRKVVEAADTIKEIEEKGVAVKPEIISMKWNSAGDARRAEYDITHYRNIANDKGKPVVALVDNLFERLADAAMLAAVQVEVNKDKQRQEAEKAKANAEKEAKAKVEAAEKLKVENAEKAKAAVEAARKEAIAKAKEETETRKTEEAAKAAKAAEDEAKLQALREIQNKAKVKDLQTKAAAETKKKMAEIIEHNKQDQKAAKDVTACVESILEKLKSAGFTSEKKAGILGLNSSSVKKANEIRASCEMAQNYLKDPDSKDYVRGPLRCLEQVVELLEKPTKSFFLKKEPPYKADVLAAVIALKKSDNLDPKRHKELLTHVPNEPTPSSRAKRMSRGGGSNAAG